MSDILTRRLYLGNRSSSGTFEHMHDVLSVGCKPIANPRVARSLHVGLKDGADADITPILNTCAAFIAESPHEVLVHCNAGMRRSPAVVLAYLCRHKDMTVEDALTLIETRRPSVRVRESQYVAQIRKWLLESTPLSRP